MLLEDVIYADAFALVRECFDGMVPAPSLSVAEWAATRRWLANAGGGYVGRWKHDEVPYVVEPMECLTGTDFLTVAVVGPGQAAKTEIAHNWLLHSVDTDPASFLWYMQTDAGLEAHVKSRIQPMIDAHEDVRRRLGTRPSDDTLHYKAFRGMEVQFLSATASNLINKSAPRIVADEIDAYPSGLGDVKALLDIRRQTFGRESKLLALSHPDLARGLDPARDWTAGVMAIYADSDRRLWWWPCPECNGWSSPNPTAARHMAIDYPADAPLDEIQDAARLLCPICGVGIEDKHRRAMNAAGRWICQGEQIDQDGQVSGARVRRDTAGFWVVGAMSPFVMGGIGGLARARAKAEREAEASGDDDTLRQVVVKQWGQPFGLQRKAGQVDAATLAERCEPGLRLGQVAEGVRFLTASADVQANRFELLVRGWGVEGESWIVDRRVIPAAPATNADDWDRLVQLLLEGSWPLADGSGRRMRIRAAAYDSGGEPGVTEQAYAAWLRARRGGLLRRAGTIDGRDAWFLLPAKGVGTANAPRLQVVYPDTARKDRKAAARGAVPLLLHNANLYKDALAGQLARAQYGRGYVHLPEGLKSPVPPHDVLEQLVAEERLPNGRWAKPAGSAGRNELMDLMTMSHAVAQLHGLARLDWSNPPAWAQPAGTNPHVFTPAPGAPAADAADDPVEEAAPIAAPPPVEAAAALQVRRNSWLRGASTGRRW